MKLYLFSSTPRSGSLLFANILAQNPAIHATHNSGMLDTMFELRRQWGSWISHAAQREVADKAKFCVMRSILKSYHEWANKEIVVDHSRDWCEYLPMFEHHYGQRAKVILLYRDVPDILASFEKRRHETSKTDQPPDENNNMWLCQTLRGRCDVKMMPNNTVGMSLNRINDCIATGYRDRLYPVSYDDLCKSPKIVMRGIYNFLGEKPFEHDFNNVKQVIFEDDRLHGYVGLHSIKPKIEWVPSDAARVIGAELVDAYSKHNLKF